MLAVVVSGLLNFDSEVQTPQTAFLQTKTKVKSLPDNMNVRIREALGP